MCCRLCIDRLPRYPVIFLSKQKSVLIGVEDDELLMRLWLLAALLLFCSQGIFRHFLYDCISNT